MKNKIIEFLSNKKIAILGFGVEGKSTYNFIKENVSNYDVTIVDKNKIDIDEKCIYGDEYLDNLNNFDLIIKSPGINIKGHNIDINKITSQLDLLLKYNKKNVIGITGTKGKSTTTTLIYNTLSSMMDNVCLAGNIGIPILDQIVENDDTLYVVEMSSHQLEYVTSSPHIGIILNLYEDHLDHAITLEHYHECKMNMFKYQDEFDIAIYCSDNKTLALKMNDNYKGKKYKVSLNNGDIFRCDNKIIYQNETLYIDDGKRKILGDHNLENIMVCLLINKLFNLDMKKAKEIIDSFNGLEHRLEYCGTYNDIIYYSDTIATIPEATISGINALKNVSTLIIGGMDRGINYNDFIFFLNNSNIDNIICMPSTGYQIAKSLTKNYYLEETLESAVKRAKEVTKKNSICLLSPAASSYEYFKNYKEKGDKFKELIK